MEFGEAIWLGQRVSAWVVEVERAGQWEHVAAGESVGYRRLVRLSGAAVDAVRVRYTQTAAPVALRVFAVYGER